MTVNTFIVTSRKADLEALRYQGIVVSQSWPQIKSSLEKNLSPGHAAILATPYIAGDGSTIDWYSEAAGPVTAWADLDPGQQGQALDTLGRLGADIAALAREMKNHPDEASVTRGNIIALALRYPSPDNIFLVGEQPVLTCWGFASASAVGQPQDLLRAGLTFKTLAATDTPPAPEATPPPPASAAPIASAAPAAPAAPQRRPSKAFNWLLLIPLLLSCLLTIALFYALSIIPGCSDRPILPGCSSGRQAEDAAASPDAPAPEARGAETARPQLNQEIQDLARREQALHERLAQLRLELMRRASQCPDARNSQLPQSPEPQPPAPQPPAPQPPRPPEPRPQEQPPAAQAPPPMAQLLPQSQEPPRRETVIVPETRPERDPEERRELMIPEQARERNDMSFLQGCWLSATNIYNEDGEPVLAEYCFDQNGRGQRNVRQAELRDCSGPLRARFESNGRLFIESEAAACNDGSAYVPQRVECSGSGDSTQCYGQELNPQNPDSARWQAGFRRQ